MQKINSVTKIYILKKINRIRFNNIYIENRLKYFRIREMQTENARKEKIVIL